MVTKHPISTIGDLCYVTDGAHAKVERRSTGILYLTSKNIGVGNLILDKVDYISHDDYERLFSNTTRAQRRLKAGDVLIGIIGTFGNAYLYKTTDHFGVSSAVAILRPDQRLLDSKYLYYVVTSNRFREIHSAYKSGSVQGYTNIPTIRQLPIPIPPLSEQKAIAHILGTLDDKIELNQQMSKALEAVAKAIFKNWFVYFDHVRTKASGQWPHGLKPEIAALFPDAFEDSDLGEIPTGWTITSLKQLFPSDSNCVITGPFGSNLHASDYREEGVPLLLVKNIANGSIVEEGMPLVGWHKVPELERYRLKEGDIIFTRVGAVGRSAYIHPRYVGWMISGQTLRVSISNWNILHPRYLTSVFQHPAFIAMVESHALGTTRPSLNTKILQSFEFLYPPPELQMRYARIVSALDERRLANQNQIGTLAALRDSLLTQLVTGELRVTDAERIMERAT